MPSYNASAIDKNYVSSIYFLDKRDILDKVLDVTNEELSFIDVLDAFKLRTPTSSAEFHHYVNKPLYNEVTFATTDATGLGVRKGDILVVKDANAHTNSDAGDIWYIKTPTTIFTAGSVKYLGNNYATKGTAPTTLIAGQKATVISNAFGEGSRGASPVRWGLKKYMGRVQVFKMGYEITDVEMANKVEVSFGGQEYYMYKAQNDALNKYKIDISAGMYFNPEVASSFSGFNNDLQSPPTATTVLAGVTDADGNRVQFTRGLHDWAKMGINQIGVSGTTVLDKFAVINKAMNVLRAPKHYLLPVGTDANTKMDNAIKVLNVGSGGGVANQGQRTSVDGRSLDFTLDTFTIYGRTWDKVELPMFDHEIGQAALGANSSSYMYMIPRTKIKVAGEEGTVDPLRVRYLEGPNMNFGYREYRLGGLAPTPTDDRSVFECKYESIQGLQVVGAEWFGVATL